MLSFSQSQARSLAVDFIARYCERVPGDKGKWRDNTLAVKECLAKIGENELFYRPIYSSKGEMSEFLLDFVGWREKNQGRPGGAVIACESEWAHTKSKEMKADKVVEDFDKLMSFKAPLKLMIFDSYGEADARAHIISEIDRYLSDFEDHRYGETYLIFDLGWQKFAWEACISAANTCPKLCQFIQNTLR